MRCALRRVYVGEKEKERGRVGTGTLGGAVSGKQTNNKKKKIRKRVVRTGLRVSAKEQGTRTSYLNLYGANGKKDAPRNWG